MINTFNTFEANNVTQLNEIISNYCNEKLLVEVSRSAPTISSHEGIFRIYVTSEFRDLSSAELKEKQNAEKRQEAIREMKFQNTLIIELDLSPHIVNVLGREGIYCIADMIKRYKKDELIKMKGLGPKSKKELVSKLKQLGLGEPLEY